MHPRAVLAASLCLNLGIAAALVLWPRERPEPAIPAPGAAASSPLTDEPGVMPEFGPVGSESGRAPFHWASVESDDYRQYIANLRAIACPEETIRDIIIADVSKIYAPRVAALRDPNPAEFKYWQPYRAYHDTGPERERQIQALYKEKEALLEELLGVNPKKVHDELNWHSMLEDERLAFLPEDKRDLIGTLKKKYREEVGEIHQKAGNHIDPETEAEVAAARKRFLDGLGTVLTPEELFEYDIRTSDIASNARRELAFMEPTEDEFREIFKARKAAAESTQTGADGLDDAERQRRRQAAEKEADKALRELLGPERYVEYKRANDWSYISLVRMGDYFGYDKAVATTIVEMRDDKRVADQVRAVKANTELSQAEKAELLNAMREETERTIAGAIGEKALKAYKRQGGYWIKNMFTP